MTATTVLKRIHAHRLRDVFRSAGWPYKDVLEIDLLAAGLLERILNLDGHEWIRVTDAGIEHLAGTRLNNQQARSAHESLVNKIVETMLRDGRIVWTGLSLRARVSGKTGDSVRWRMCIPDVFSIRSTSRPEYLEPVVHEIKVSRADLLGDLKCLNKRQAYLDVGGQCWYVLGCNPKGQAIAEPDEVPTECGVMLFKNNELVVLRMAPRRPVAGFPFHAWMALAKAAPVRRADGQCPPQELLV